MKTLFKMIAASAATLSLLITPVDIYSQTRSTGSTSTRSTSTQSRSTGSTSTRSTSTQSRSTGTTTTRSTGTQSRSTGTTTTRSTGTQNRTTGTTTSSSTGTQNRTTGTTTSRSTGTTSSRSTGTTTSSSTGTQNRTTGTTSGTRTTGTTSTRSTGTGTRTTGTTSSSGNVRSTSSGTTSSRVAGSLQNDTRSTSSRGTTQGSVREQSQRAVGNATRNGLTTYDRNNSRGSSSNVMNESRNDFLRIGDDRNVHRVPPRDRDFLAYDRPSNFWSHDHHYYGYRVNYLPPHFRRINHWGIDYCFYNGIYYRPYGNMYVVCRPPFGIALEIAIADALFSNVHFAYYNNTYRVYSSINANNRIIDEQNRIIARNNATIAAQNANFALNTARANDSYSIANRLGLVQSYAYADQPYYYQDGVFYIVNSNQKYEVIVPPSGALVTDLPDDYDTISIDGNDFYKVDDTVYRLTLVDGTPYLEVLGQMYGKLAQKYNANLSSYGNLY